MIASNRKHTATAQQVETPVVLAVEQVLSVAAAETDIIAGGAENLDHLPIEMAGMNLIAIHSELRIHFANVHAQKRICSDG
jgi:hypothetical protein